MALLHNKHCAFACELGSNYGHIAPVLALARRAAAKGAHISLVVPSLTAINFADIADFKFDLYQAPVNLFLKAKANVLPQTYAETLLLQGYSQAGALATAIKVWRSLWQQLQPDAVFFDYAPTALLASRGLGFKKFVLGNGYCVPPKQCAQLALPNQTPATERLAASDAQVLTTVNQALQCNQLATINHIEDMHRCDERFLLTVAALDCYQKQRKGEAYWGFLPASYGTLNATWPNSHKPRLFAYLSTSFPFIQQLLTWLQLHFVGHVFIAGKNAAQYLVCSTPHLQISLQAYDLSNLLPSCDLVLCHGGSNTVAQALMAAKPVVCIALQREQQFTAERIAQNQLGESITPKPTWEQLQQQLDPILAKLPTMQARAQTFRQQYRAEFGKTNTAAKILTRCAEILKA